MGGTVIPRLVEQDLDRLATMATGSRPSDAKAAPWLGDGDDDTVTRAVYASWYLGLSGRRGADADVSRTAERPEGSLAPVQRRTAALLRGAHADGARFEDGWVVVATDGPFSAVERGGDRRVVAAGDLANLRRPAVPVHPGDEVAVVRRRDVVDPDTGYWVTRSPCGEPDGALGRLYVDVDLESVGSVLGLLTAGLLALDDVPWSLKCPTDPLAYERVDTIVCYVPRVAEDAVRAVARTVLDLVGDRLVPRVPPLTDRIGPGIAWADDPGSDDSFGMDRCRALTPAVIRLARAREHRRPVEALVDALVEAGIDPCTPWRAARPGASVR
jgi:hypothetical protein